MVFCHSGACFLLLSCRRRIRIFPKVDRSIRLWKNSFMRRFCTRSLLPSFPISLAASTMSAPCNASREFLQTLPTLRSDMYVRTVACIVVSVLTCVCAVPDCGVPHAPLQRQCPSHVRFGPHRAVFRPAWHRQVHVRLCNRDRREGILSQPLA